MGKYLPVVVVIVLGAVVTGVVDVFLDIDYPSHGAHIAHGVLMLLWGALIGAAFTRTNQ